VSRAEDVQNALADALAQALAGEPEVVTRWISVIEVMDSDGKRGIYLMPQQGAQAWDSLGLLLYAIQVEQAGCIVREGKA
jgi:hypothetical protein